MGEGSNKVPQREEEKKKSLTARCNHSHTGAQPTVTERLVEGGRESQGFTKQESPGVGEAHPSHSINR